MKKIFIILLIQFVCFYQAFATIGGLSWIDPDVPSTYTLSFPDYPPNGSITWSLNSGDPASISSSGGYTCSVTPNRTQPTNCYITVKATYEYTGDDGMNHSHTESLTVHRLAFVTGPQVVYPGESFTYTIVDPCYSSLCYFDWHLTTGETNTSSVNSWNLNGVSVTWPSTISNPGITSIGTVRCTATCSEHTVTVLPYPISIALRQPVIGGPASVLCGDVTPITYTATCTGATYYVWSMPSGWTGSSTTNNITVTPNGVNGGNISVTAYAANGSVVHSTLANYAVALQKITAISGSELLCPNITSTYTAVSTPGGMPGPFVWTLSTPGWQMNGIATPFALITTTNTVSITAPAGASTAHLCVRDDAACSSACFDISSSVPATPVFYSTDPTTVCPGGSVIFWHIYSVPTATSYTWSTTSTHIHLEPNEITGLTVGGPNIVKVTANNACGSSPAASKSVAVINTGLCTTRSLSIAADGIESQTENGINTFPNPVAEDLTININTTEAAMYTISLYDVLGKKVYSANKEVAAGKNESDIDVSKLINGIYFLQIDNGVDVHKEKIIVNH